MQETIRIHNTDMDEHEWIGLTRDENQVSMIHIAVQFF